jgi:hypothetical protein
MSLSSSTGPIEVWLTQRNMEVNCRIVLEDESTDGLNIESLSMRGAQREVTGYLIGRGYKPHGRWTVEQSDDEGATETSRTFKHSNKVDLAP